MQETFEASCTSAGGVITLIKAICKGDVQNGMAVVRPPGHHAMENEYNGYCFFNNVALAAKIMIEEDLARKILIIDHDVHHGQGTQRFFYNSNRYQIVIITLLEILFSTLQCFVFLYPSL